MLVCHTGHMCLQPTNLYVYSYFTIRIYQGHGNHVGRNCVGRVTRTGCTGMLVRAHVLQVLGCGFNLCDCSRVVVRTCKCTDCTDMLVRVHGLQH